jgi:hypothetical protein
MPSYRRKFSNRYNPRWNNDKIHAVTSVRFHVCTAGFLVTVTMFGCYFIWELQTSDSPWILAKGILVTVAHPFSRAVVPSNFDRGDASLLFPSHYYAGIIISGRLLVTKKTMDVKYSRDISSCLQVEQN